ncbi:MAG: toll/interleukin-1 receptor domain-containing protein, partial [Anaerolineae bacterium]|nr:toll/interleukin-1 receptor domain-containing protein [Anaerolineae bacterium]
MDIAASEASPRVFIAYSPEDVEFALWLSAALRGVGHEVWIGQDDVVAGRNTLRAMQSALDHAEVMLLIITPESLQSRLVESQWTYFYCECEKPLIPIVRRPPGAGDQLNFVLASLQSIDFSNKNEQTGESSSPLARLHHALQAAPRSLPTADNEASSSFPTPLNAPRNNGTHEAGILSVYPAMPVELFLDWASNASQTIQILNTWTGLLARQPQRFLESLNRGCTIQILLLNPSSPFARQRSRDLSLEQQSRDADELEVPRNIQTAIRQLADLFREAEAL